jgi:hypothetical protein
MSGWKAARGKTSMKISEDVNFNVLTAQKINFYIWDLRTSDIHSTLNSWMQSEKVNRRSILLERRGSHLNENQFETLKIDI